MGKPGFEDLMLDIESDTAAYGGQFAKARELTRRAVESAQRADEKETAARYEAEAAVREALVGNMSQAKQQAQAALALSTGRDVEAMSAIALGLAGDARSSHAAGRRPSQALPRRHDRTVRISAHDPRGRCSPKRQRQQGTRSARPGCAL